MRRVVLSALLTGLVVSCDAPSRPLEPTDPSDLAVEPQISAAAAGLLPDLRTVVPRDIVLESSIGGPETLRFENSIANTGRGPWQMRPRFPLDGTSGTQDAIQQILDANGRVVSQKVVSRFQYHEDHDHWHIVGVALYQIRSGSLSGPLVGDTPRKTTFCLIDSKVLAGFPNQARRTYTNCSQQARKQGISVGWVDVYERFLPDQDLDITGAPAGIYYLISTVNAGRRFTEANYGNNRAWVKFQLQRDVLGRPTIRIVGHSPCTGGLCGS